MSRLVPALVLVCAFVATQAAPAAAALETTQVDFAELTIRGDGADDVITVGCEGAFLKINGGDPPNGPLRCNRLLSLEVESGLGSDAIDVADLSDAGRPRNLLQVTVDAGGGRDRILGSSASFETIDGGSGPDRIRCGDASFSGADGGPGNDVISGGGGLIAVHVGGAGNDRIVGGTGEGSDLPAALSLEIFAGGPGADRIYGRVGLDEIVGNQGRDRLYGGPSADLIEGNRGSDLLVGNAGRDRLTGGGGRDRLRGGPGRDREFQGGRPRNSEQGSEVLPPPPSKVAGR